MTGDALAVKPQAIGISIADVPCQQYTGVSIKMDTRSGNKTCFENWRYSKYACQRLIVTCLPFPFSSSSTTSAATTLRSVYNFVFRTKCVYNQPVFLHRLSITLEYIGNSRSLPKILKQIVSLITNFRQNPHDIHDLIYFTIRISMHTLKKTIYHEFPRYISTTRDMVNWSLE